jgi:hypothetical protein
MEPARCQGVSFQAPSTRAGSGSRGLCAKPVLRPWQNGKVERLNRALAQNGPTGRSSTATPNAPTGCVGSLGRRWCGLPERVHTD